MNRLPFWKASSTTGKHLAPLLDLQFFLFGRDIEHPAGNRLRAAGFTRRRSSEERDHCSVYQCGNLSLWGFGLHWCGADTALYLPRKPWGPRLLSTDLFVDMVWSKREMPTGQSPTIPDDEVQLRLLLREALSWLAEYEATSWEEDSTWRQKCLAGWPHKTTLPQSLAAEWQKAASDLMP
ncbi:MAG: hypothetical protein QM758_22920 [Armatimonas sp.]